MSHANILFILGVVGILFYAVGPLFFPNVPNIRQPELLPVYSLMIGLGGLLRKPIEPPKGSSAPVPLEMPDMKELADAQKAE